MQKMINHLCGFKFQLEGSNELIEFKIRAGNGKEYFADLFDSNGDIHTLCALTEDECLHLADALKVAAELIREWEARDSE